MDDLFDLLKNKKGCPIRTTLAADPGFEPGQNESESLVLPLHKSAMSADEDYNTTKIGFCQHF